MVFKADGALHQSEGFDSNLMGLFDIRELYEKTKDKLLRKGEQSYITLNSSNCSFFAATVCSCGIREGFYIVGPYVSDKSQTSTILYKPESCIPHLAALLQAINKDMLPKDSRKASDKEPYSFYIKKALDYINKNYHEGISLDNISKYLDINKCYFCSLFKNETDKTFSQYLNELRIEKSKDLLSKKNLSLLDIALTVGFNNQNYFNMIFKKLTNMTPLEFRNSML
jgi:AraC-like DNA-binding protein